MDLAPLLILQGVGKKIPELGESPGISEQDWVR